MDLTIKENTFKKNLLAMGYNVSIVSYQNMISFIQSHVQGELLLTLKNGGDFQQHLNKIFGYIYHDLNSPSIAILYDNKWISFIQDSYLKHLIDHNYLNAFIISKDSNERVSKATLINAYKLEKLKEIKKELKHEVFGLFLHYIKNKTTFFSLIKKLKINIFETTFDYSSPSFVKANSIEFNDLDDSTKYEIDVELLTLLKEFRDLTNSITREYNAFSRYGYRFSDDFEILDTLIITYQRDTINS